MSNIIEVKDLCKDYKVFNLKNVSFSLPKGYIMGFIGPNGAGKTTTIKAMLDMIGYDSGVINIFEKDIKKENVKDEIGVVMDLPFYVDDWNSNDVEKAVAPFYTKWDHKIYRELLERFNIDPKKKIKELSRGMKVKVMAAVALSHNAKLLILDEPTSGLDPVARDELMDILREFMMDDERGVLFSTHITSDLEKIADYITYIKSGEIIFSGLKSDLMEKYLLVKGGTEDIEKTDEAKIMGLRKHSAGFEGMIERKDKDIFKGDFTFDPVSLEEIIIFMNKEGKKNG